VGGEVIAVLAALGLVFTLVARRLSAINLTAPMLSVVAGFIVFAGTDVSIDTGAVHLIAELALVVVLFHDASTVRLSKLRRDPGIAARLLLIGFPLAVIATFLLTREMLPAIGVAGAWLLTASITPTDAGLGAPTVLNPVVPTRVRRGLNVESGLNDGLATPIVMLALSALVAEAGDAEPSILQIGVVPVVLALVCATGVALLAAWAMDRSRERGWSTHRGRALATAAVPLVLFGLAEIVGANVFITAFVAGLVFGAASITLDEEHETSDVIEIAADLLGFVVWFFAGGILLTVLQVGVQWQWVLLAVLALTVLRMVPVFLALIGTGFRWQTILFIGWFGPRGLATIVFGLLAFEELGADATVMGPVAGVIAFTVLISVFAHGISAGPLSRRYGAWARSTQAPVESTASVEPQPARGRSGF